MGISGGGQAASDAEGRRSIVHSGRSDPFGDEHWQQPWGRACHLYRRKRQAPPDAGKVRGWLSADRPCRSGRLARKLLMSTTSSSPSRRQLLSAASRGLALAGAASLVPGRARAAVTPDTIRPFRINVPE